MLHYQHMDVFAGLPVTEFGEPGRSVTSETAPGEVAWRLRVDRDRHLASESFGDHFDRFLATVDTSQVQALIVGCWSDVGKVDAQMPRDLLVGAAGRFPKLRALFFGEHISEENEISWIPQVDITPLLRAFPGLEELWTRGGAGVIGEGLKLQPDTYPALRRLVMQSCGLPVKAVRGVAASEFPALDLSMGTMTDRGAQALIDGQSLAHLRSLNLRRNYLNEAMVGRLRGRWPGVRVNLDDQMKRPIYEGDDYYYVEVAE